MQDFVPKPLPPSIGLPEPFVVPPLDYDPPKFKNPKWEPIPIFREDLAVPLPEPSTSDKEESSKKTKDTSKSVQPKKQEPLKTPNASDFKEVQKINIPVVNIEVPVPKTEILVTAVSTAGVASVASVGGTLAATAIFKRLIQVSKPAITFLLKKVAKARGKQAPLSWSRKRLAQRRSKSD